MTQKTTFGNTKYVMTAKTISNNPEKINPISKSAKVVTAAMSGPAKPERVITMKGVLFLRNIPLSNKNPGHNFVMPGSWLLRFFSGIHPIKVGKNGAKANPDAIQNKV
mmetsp:Transcript_7269/g.14584  ORF Transcript_7269/g.14584 Transcript_7269/m.14584 type:complete len:108 (-) Transcript_7269:968-1291(-)